MNRIWCLLLLFTLFCQRNTPDADELLPVTAMAVSYENGAYHLLLEGVRQSSLDGDAAPVYLAASAGGMDSLFDEAQAVLADRLTFTHATLALVDPSLDYGDVAALCRVLLDVQGAPRAAYLAYAANGSAEELLTHEHPVEEIPGLGLRDLLRGVEIAGNAPVLNLENCKKLSDTGKGLALHSLDISSEDQVICSEIVLFGDKANPLTGGGTA